MQIDLGAFIGVSALVIMTPGQDTALVIRNTLAGGRATGIRTALGVVAGQATWTLASGVGLTALLLASAPAFAAVRLAGAAYLIYLGAQSLHRALFGRASHVRPASGSCEVSPPAHAAFRQGLFSALGNPKLAVFFVSLLPQFVPHGRMSLAVLLGLGFSFCAMTLLWLAGYSVVVGKARRLLEASGIRRTLEGVLGATLIALGIRVAAERR